MLLSADMLSRSLVRLLSPVLLLGFLVLSVQSAPPPRGFQRGSPKTVEDLPPGRLRTEIQNLPESARGRALRWLQSFHFTESDVASLHADPEGGILYSCVLSQPESPAQTEPPPIGEVAVPVSPFPSNLIFHSRPGAPNVLYINFSGENVSNTEWNTTVGRTTIPAVPFSADSDYTTFSDSEQLAIKRIWQRIAEDYAPFNIDVTTERPASFTTRTAHALITRNTDANGDANPYSSAGGVAYVNVFGTTSYARYRPAWIYCNNLGNNESYIAEAASHEVGHNMGLSHDGKTDGTEYYGGHGSGDISWGPLMGTGYNRNVSQWCKGEYYLANNTQDDLATIAGKLTYRTDDHGNTSGTATPLLVSGTNILSTTPDTDPASTNTANKGVLERNTDLDVFSFSTGNGTVRLAVNPWIVPGGLTRGGNVDLALQLYTESGVLVLTNNSPSLTTTLIQTNLAQGRYFLHIRNSNAGSPLASSPSGYTSYGSIGQYFISGYVVPTANLVVRPVAELQITDVNVPGAGSKLFSVTYSDDVAIDTATLDSSDIRVLGPNGYDRPARFVSVDISTAGTPRVATYAADPPLGATWTGADNGTYAVFMQTNQVLDNAAASVLPGQLGQFNVSVPSVVYAAGMDANPGWILEPEWQYGAPNYGSTGPSSGFTGNNIIGYNLSGDYANRLSAKYATTPVINCSGNSSLTLRFRRWLRLQSSDIATIEASTNGTFWINIWSTSSAVADSAWQEVQYSLPTTVAGSPSLRLRWGLSSNPSKSDLGWNIDDVQLLGDGVLDTAPPVPYLSVADLTLAGSPTHACTVTYTDESGVRLASLDSMDVMVTGPGGYSNRLEFTGADLPMDGSPCAASYAIPAPGGSWDAADNGTYQLALVENEVEDVLGNALPGRALGSFNVAIVLPQQFSLSIGVNNPAWGTVSPTGGTYTAGSSIELRASPTAYFQFEQWTGDLSGTDNPLMLVVTSNVQAQASFREMRTTNYSVPFWWLASFGYTGDYESLVTANGVNNFLIWQSWVAGLVPTNPVSQFRLTATPAPGGSCILSWNTATNRLYTLWSATNATGPFAPLSGASDLPPTITSFTHNDSTGSRRFYRVEVKVAD